MVFDYSEYVSKFLVFPVLCILFLIPIFITSFRNLICSLINLSRCKEIYEEIIKQAIACILVLFLVGLNAKTLYSGGAWLLVENETSIVEATGTISCIKRVGKHEYQIVLENQKYLVIDIGEFSEGDCVRIRYLPESGYVLSIRED